jgi:hypothetical protein
LQVKIQYVYLIPTEYRPSEKGYVGPYFDNAHENRFEKLQPAAG